MTSANVQDTVIDLTDELIDRAARLRDGTNSDFVMRDDWLNALGELVNLRATVAALEAACVTGARASLASWGQIGDALGVSKQAAQQRFGD